MRADILTSILHELNGRFADIEACGVISIDGVVMASVLPQELDEDSLGAMSAAMLSIGDETARKLFRSGVEQVTIKGPRGEMLMIHAGEEAMLTVMANPKAEFNLIYPEAKRAAASIADLI